MRDSLILLTKEEKRIRNNAAVRKHYYANKEKRAEKTRAWLKSNPEQAKKLRLRGNLKYAYGITPEQKDALLLRNGGVCDVCGTRDPGSKGWYIDHDHSIVEKGLDCIRGIVCPKCNLSLGLNGDTLEGIISTYTKQLNYLKAWEDRKKVVEQR